MKKMSPVYKAQIEKHGSAPHEHIRVHFSDATALKEFSASLIEMADSDEFDHVHLQDHDLSKEKPDAGIEIVFLKEQWED